MKDAHGKTVLTLHVVVKARGVRREVEEGGAVCVKEDGAEGRLGNSSVP